MISSAEKIIGAIVACGIVLALVWFAGSEHGATKVRRQFDAYIASEKLVTAAAVQQQKDEGDAAVAKLQAQLDAAQTDSANSDEDVRKLQAALAAKPPVAGRGATQDDVEALNR